MRITVFCGSSFGNKPAYKTAAAELGSLIASKGLGLVYGGASVGLMGEVANAALEQGGEVIGVLPKSLANLEIEHPHLTQLHIVDSMHERKAMMAELSTAFVALPGGIGTLEELFEIWTWSQLGIHRKPLGLLNVDNYFESLIDFLNSTVDKGFLRTEHRALLLNESSPDALIDKLMNAEVPKLKKWVDAENS